MNGFHMGTLQIITLLDDYNFTYPWLEMGDQGIDWFPAEVDINMDNVIEVKNDETVNNDNLN